MGAPGKHVKSSKREVTERKRIRKPKFLKSHRPAKQKDRQREQVKDPEQGYEERGVQEEEMIHTQTPTHAHAHPNRHTRIHTHTLTHTHTDRHTHTHTYTERERESGGTDKEKRGVLLTVDTQTLRIKVEGGSA